MRRIAGANSRENEATKVTRGGKGERRCEGKIVDEAGGWTVFYALANSTMAREMYWH